MAQWEPILGGSLFGQVFQPLESVANTISNIISPLQSILKIIQTILKIIRAFIVGLASLLIAIIQTLVNEIEKFLQELANSGVYILTLAPDFSSTQAFYDSTAGGFPGFVNKIYGKFNDVSDAQRPVFPPDQPCGGIVLAVNSGDIMGALNLLSLVSRGFKNLFQQTYMPPVIRGTAGNGVNVIYFERPNLPSNIFNSVRYEVQRAVAAGGSIKKSAQPVSDANPNSDTQTTTESVRNLQNSEVVVSNYNTIQVIDSGNAITGTNQYLIIDGVDTVSPQLVKFDLSTVANTIAVNRLQNPLVQSTALGPKSFSLNQSSLKNAFVYQGASTLDQINASVPAGSQDAVFANKKIGNYWIDFRINGFSIPTAANADVNNPSQMYVTAFDGQTVTLSQNVPVGSKIIVYTYVQAKTSDVILLNDFYAKLNKVATSKFYVNGPGATPDDTDDAPDDEDPSDEDNIDEQEAIQDSGVQNDITYFYRVVVTATTQNTETFSDADATDKTGYPVLAKSNEIRLTPRLNVTKNTMRAYCLSSKQGPFVVTLDTNKLDFSVGSKRYQCALRPSILNNFSISSADFNNKYGLLLDPQFRPATTNVIQTAINTGNATSAVVNALGGTSGITFNYYGSDGRQHSVAPGGYIPRDPEEILLDLQSQCDRSVRFAAKNGRIMIQDASYKSSSLVIMNIPNTALGFTAGTCMSTTYATTPNWHRYAVKDFIPQIYDLAALIQSFANGLISSIESATKTLTDFIDLISAKIKALQDFLNKIQQLLNTLKNLKVLLPNMYILKVGPVGGSVALANAILNATNQPLSSPSDVAFGIVIVVGGLPALTVLPILKLIL